jgi:hypothetical protein
VAMGLVAFAEGLMAPSGILPSVGLDEGGANGFGR